MTDELDWLRSHAPDTPGPDDEVLAAARARFERAIELRSDDLHDQLPDLPIEGLTPVPGPEPVRRRDGRLAVAGSLAAGLVLVAAAITVLRPGDDGAEDAADDGTAIEASEPDSGVDTVEEAGAEDDNPEPVAADEESPAEQLEPVTVQADVDSDLADGQTIHVAGDGYPTGRWVWLVQCVASGEEPDPAGCDPGTSQVSVVASDGMLATEYIVDRHLDIGTADVDCAEQRCEVLITTSDDERRTGRLPIAFDPDQKPHTAPRIEVDTSELVDGQTVVVTGENFEPGDELYLVQCAVGQVETVPSCLRREIDPAVPQRRFVDTSYTPVLAGALTVAADGTFTETIIGSRLVRTGLGNLDCVGLASGGCVVMVVGPPDADGYSRRVVAAKRLNFDPDAAPPQPGIGVSPATGFADLEPVSLTVTAALWPDVYLCGTGSQCLQLVGTSGLPAAGLEIAPEQRGSTFVAELALPRVFTSAEGIEHDCVLDGPCEIRVVAPGFPSDPLPLVFDPDAPLAPPVEVHVTPDGPYQAGDAIVLTMAATSRVSLFQCVAGDIDDRPVWERCDNRSAVGYDERLGSGYGLFGDGTHPPEVTGDQLEMRLRVYRRLQLGDGTTHDCVTDGPCELVLASFVGVDRYPVIPLAIDPDSAPLSGPSVVLDRAFKLVDGQEANLSISNLASVDRVTVELCPADTEPGFPCGLLARPELDGSDRLTITLSLPRFTPDHAHGYTFDCADSCLLRVSTPRHHVDVAIGFERDGAVLPPPTLEISTEPTVPGDTVEIVGTGFRHLPDDPDVTVWVCGDEPDWIDGSAPPDPTCGHLDPTSWVQPPELDENGDFVAALVVPRRVAREDGASTPAECSLGTCWLVVTSKEEVAGGGRAAVQLTEGELLG